MVILQLVVWRMLPTVCWIRTFSSLWYAFRYYIRENWSKIDSIPWRLSNRFRLDFIGRYGFTKPTRRFISESSKWTTVNHWSYQYTVIIEVGQQVLNNKSITEIGAEIETSLTFKSSYYFQEKKRKPSLLVVIQGLVVRPRFRRF